MHSRVENTRECNAKPQCTSWKPCPSVVNVSPSTSRKPGMGWSLPACAVVTLTAAAVAGQRCPLRAQIRDNAQTAVFVFPVQERLETKFCQNIHKQARAGLHPALINLSGDSEDPKSSDSLEVRPNPIALARCGLIQSVPQLHNIVLGWGQIDRSSTTVLAHHRFAFLQATFRQTALIAKWRSHHIGGSRGTLRQIHLTYERGMSDQGLSQSSSRRHLLEPW